MDEISQLKVALAQIAIHAVQTTSEFVRLQLHIAERQEEFDGFRMHHGIGDNIYTVSYADLLGAFIKGMERFGVLDLDDLDTHAEPPDPFELLNRAKDNWSRGFTADAFNCLALAFYLGA